MHIYLYYTYPLYKWIICHYISTEGIYHEACLGEYNIQTKWLLAND